MPRAQIKRNWKIEVSAKFGSEFQAEVFENTLKYFIGAMAEGIRKSHKRNKVDVSVSRGLFDTPKKPDIVPVEGPTENQSTLL